MKFIVLLFAVLLQRQTKQQGYTRNNGWYVRLLTPFNLREMDKKGQILTYALLVGVPCLVVSVCLSYLTGVMGAMLSIVIQVLLFLYILGRDDFSGRFNDYKTCWQREDYQAAFLCAQQFLHVEKHEQSETPLQLHKNVQEAIMMAWFQRFFIFAFWFLVAGIGGTLFCLLTFWFHTQSKALWGQSILHGLAWAPARVLCVSIALAGNFVDSFAKASRFMLDFDSTSQTVLHQTLFHNDDRTEDDFDCANALTELEQINQLMQRCAILWILVVACLTVFAGF